MNRLVNIMFKLSLSNFMGFISILACFSSSAYGVQSAQAYTSAYRYDLMGQLTGAISPDPDGSGPIHYAATRYSYDASGRPTTIESGELSSWKNETIAPSAWGSSFRVDRVLRKSYDRQDRVTQEAAEADGTLLTVTQYSYDGDGRLQCKAVRMNPAEFSSLPSSACSQSSPTSHPVKDRIERYTYDDAGQLRKVIRAYATSLSQGYASYTYSDTGKKTSVTDANGNYTEYRFDGHDRLNYMYFPSKASTGLVNTGDYELYEYDDNGNRTRIRRRDGYSTYYTYDPLDRVTLKDLPGGSFDVYYGYDNRSLETYARFRSASGKGITNEYDGFGRLESTTDDMGSNALTVSYRYDINSNRTRITHPDNVYFTYSYDGLDRQRVLYQSSSTTRATPKYNAQGTLESLTRSGGAKASYRYDSLLRIEQYTLDLGGTANDLTQVFTYNPASQIIAKTPGNSEYHYLGDDNMTGTYVANGLNQYTAIDGVSLDYDSKGNLEKGPSGTNRYDYENRLTGTFRGSTPGAFKYDPKGRLSSYRAGGPYTQFLYDGDALIAEYDDNGNVVKRYVHGAGIDQPLMQFNGSSISNASYWRDLHSNHQGSIIAQTNNYAQVTAINTYDAYGIPDPGNQGRFGYTGQVHLPEINLYYYKARMYSPEVGRFLQTDPVGYEDQMNLYVYVGNDPMNLVDPTGKFAVVLAIPWAVTAIKAALFTGSAAAVAYGASEAVNAYNESSEGFDTDNPDTSNPLTGEPGSCSECNNKNGEKKQRRHYGEDGYPDKDVDYDHAHGKGKKNSGSPHVHDWDRPDDGSAPTNENRGDARPPEPQELEDPV